MKTILNRLMLDIEDIVKTLSIYYKDICLIFVIFSVNVTIRNSLSGITNLIVTEYSLFLKHLNIGTILDATCWLKYEPHFVCIILVLNLANPHSFCWVLQNPSFGL